jgi:hypothetical protein
MSKASQQRFSNVVPFCKFWAVFDKTSASLIFSHRRPDSMTDEVESNVRTVRTFVAATLMTVSTVGFMVVFTLSVVALHDVYSWYPQFVAQQWFIYDELFTVFSLSGLISGAFATVLILSKKSFKVAAASALVCTLSSASVFVVSLVQPLAVLWQSLLYFFLPIFVTSTAGAALTYMQDEEIEKACSN